MQNHCPDQFFNAAQQKRLHELMQLWRTARNNQTEFPQQQELDELVELELLASGKLAAELNK